MEIISDSCTFGKVLKTTPKLFFDMLKNEKKGIENQCESKANKIVEAINDLFT